MSVTEAWIDLVRVLSDIAPDTAGSFLPPTPAADVEAAEAATGLLWTEELREFYSLHAGQLLPYQDLLGVDRVLSERALMIEVWQGITEADPGFFIGGYEGLLAEHPQAGSEARGYLPQYIPLSGEDGNFYFCDLRPGPLHGCVRGYLDGAADCSGPLWASISTMLDALRVSLEDGTSFQGVLESVWRVTEGHLWWRPPGPEPDSRYE